MQEDLVMLLTFLLTLSRKVVLESRTSKSSERSYNVSRIPTRTRSVLTDLSKAIAPLGV